MAIYMKYAGIDGSVSTAGFEKWIELDSVQFGHARAISSGGRDRKAVVPAVSEITVSKEHDAASSSLFRESLTGQGKAATISFTTTGKDKMTKYLQIELENTLISSWNLSGRGGADGKPTETLSLNFTKITFTTSSLNEKTQGKPDSATYDLTNMQGS